jgi:hypothetical protein
MMTIVGATPDFTTGAVLSWALPLLLVFAVLVWWAIMLTIRAFKTR